MPFQPRQPRLSAACSAVLLLAVSACASPPVQTVPSSEGSPASASPAASPAASPLPRPAASPAASPAPSPAVLPSPSPALAASPSPVAQAPLSPYPFAAMIDNIAAARPHSGLSEADVVYEAPAEGGIPRLMPVYLRGAPPGPIGPVRSARDYFVDLAQEFGAALVHIGSSPQGFAAMERLGTVRVDEARGDGGFTRDPRRRAPNNAFVTADAVRADLQARGAKLQPSTAGLQWGTFQAGSEPATRVRINYPGGERYVAEYTYDAGSRTYLRSMDGAPHVDGTTGARYAARAVIVQYVPVSPIPNDDAGRLDVQLTGTGRATLIAEGTQVPLTWTKANEFQPTRFQRQDGAPFSLPVGQTWIQVVPLETAVSISSG